ncbi:MAG: PorT family protein [Winogradskyella sp.]|nr:PorT family protein [Winogradskyella sp.]
MKLKLITLIFCYLLGQFCVAQTQSLQNDVSLDDKYREDQFYISVTYNLLRNKPIDFTQNGFSTGFSFGFIRDMPINDRRNLAVGLGLGLSANSYNQNLVIDESGSAYTYNLISDFEGDVSKNKFYTYVLELPLEFRWRTSTAEIYNFWRIYTGFKVGYVFYDQSKLRSDLKNLKISNNSDFNSWQYGVILSAGYNTWNFHFFYRLNKLFNDNAKLNVQPIDLSELRIGLIFYIL